MLIMNVVRQVIRAAQDHIDSERASGTGNIVKQSFNITLLIHVFCRYVIARIHLVNVGQHLATARPQTMPTNLGGEFVCRLLSSTPTVTECYYRFSVMIIFQQETDIEFTHRGLKT